MSRYSECQMSWSSDYCPAPPTTYVVFDGFPLASNGFSGFDLDADGDDDPAAMSTASATSSNGVGDGP